MRPEEAERLLNDPNLNEVFTLLRQRYNREFENSDLDKDQLLLIRLKFSLIRDFHSELMKILNERAMK